MTKGLPKKWFNWAIAHRKTLGASKAFKQAWAHARGSNAGRGFRPKSRSSSRRSVTKQTTHTHKRRNENTTRKKHHSRGSANIPLAVVAPLAYNIYDSWKVGGSIGGMADQLAQRFSGFSPMNGQMYPVRLAQGLGSVLVGALIHKYVGGTLGVNKTLGRSKVPLVRL